MLVTKELRSNLDNDEDNESDGLISFDSDGFTLNDDNNYNRNEETYVGWCWKANETGVTNADQTEKYSTDSGLSIITYDGSSSDIYIEHSLGSPPGIVICKRRTSPDENWAVYSSEIGNDYVLSLDGTSGAWQDDDWDNTTPDSTKIYFSGSSARVNFPSEDYVCYAFTDVIGSSKFGKYTGNGNNIGPIINCGFNPSMVIVKNTDTNGDWIMLDSIRDGGDYVNQALFSNNEELEDEAGGSYLIEFTSTGFQIRAAGEINDNNNTYLYMAFA